MKESYVKVLAKHYDPESCVINRKANDEALTGAHAGRVLSSEIKYNQGADVVKPNGKQHVKARHGKLFHDPAESKTSSMYGNLMRENREALLSSSLAQRNAA